MNTDRPINITVNVENKPYWEAAGQGKLVLRKCNSCGKMHHYPRTICPHCHSSDTAFVEASGRGEIYSYSVTRQAKPPYVIAYVTLEEGVTMLTNIVDCDLEGLSIGQKVKVKFLDAGEGMALPVFAPA
ncbi:Zn-ribbon domain-containing OB-fold protein [Parvibaculum sp.]|jgi:uncharacterized OB-fold protein|uniref:Zn-ribbon domain-containing OB-fold protein n=1 Tax=Parvibaculum sp. TaxID=2024848 RepID=UPI001B0B4A46|nr:Zn-ribbon domain-containing OB-fold protein [Parvibaculum sp.]MBO6678235.1 Zn-ribbon domain-containing OB-fold protein [Parvibaculum sp.]MBO6685449.1 Zn-ribbon domain-containing OB-fold protein [Parvibaculum sp.]